jgi:rhodanese-related sulfurtransferase
MKVIDRELLKAKLDRGDNFQLVMTLDQRAFDRMHIPGSLHFGSIQEARERLDPTAETVVYCAGKWCRSSIDAYLALRNAGFEDLYRFAGGLEEWQAAHYPLEGSLAEVAMSVV